MAKILIVSTDWGHRSIAQAVKETIRRSHMVELRSIRVERLSKISYEFMYKYIPRTFSFVFWLSEFKIFRRLFNLYAERSYQDNLESEIIKTSPDIIINTYFAFNSSLEKLMGQLHFRLINVFADPWTFSRILISKKGENLTFDKYSWQKLKSFEPQAKGLPVGWFIEKKYHQVKNIDRKLLRKKLGLNSDMFTLCVVSGSEGTFNVFKILSTLLNPKNKMQVIILCGNNSEMFKVVKSLKYLSGKIRGPKITGIAYTDSMQQYLRAADLVIGKAGPNTMFQSVAALTPFFAISHISGQEDGNLDIIKRYKIGYVEENPHLASQKLRQIIENPEVLSKLTKNLKTLANFCQGSGERLLNLLKP